MQLVFPISKISPRISKNELPVSSPYGQCANHPDAPVHVAIGKRNNERPKHLGAMFSQLLKGVITHTIHEWYIYHKKSTKRI